MNKNVAKEKRMESINLVIADNLKQIKSSWPKDALLVDPSIEDNLIIEKKKIINKKTEECLKILEDFIHYIVKIQIKDLTEQNIYVAVYSLLSLVVNDFRSALLLGENGKYTSLMTIVRELKIYFTYDYCKKN